MYSMRLVYLVFWCVKQNTAYEMRISDWSSDVCASDLSSAAAKDARSILDKLPSGFAPSEPMLPEKCVEISEKRLPDPIPLHQDLVKGVGIGLERAEIGRASCRERVCQYV